MNFIVDGYRYLSYNPSHHRGTEVLLVGRIAEFSALNWVEILS